MDITKLPRDERNRLVHQQIMLSEKTNTFEKMLRELIESLGRVPESSRIQMIKKVVDELNETTTLSNFVNK